MYNYKSSRASVVLHLVVIVPRAENFRKHIMAINEPGIINQPTPLWRFTHAVYLLEHCNEQDQTILDLLDEFLLLHRSLLTDANPLHKPHETTAIPTDTKDINIRGITYRDITPTNIEDSAKLSDVLGLDQKECLRIISQISNKVLENRIGDIDHSKLKLIDNQKTQEKLVLYGSMILEERRTIVECGLELLNKKLDTLSSLVIQNLGKDLFLSHDYINGIITSLNDTLKHLTAGQPRLNDIFDVVYYRESLLYIIVCLKVLVEATFQNSTTISVDIIINWFRLVIKFDLAIEEREPAALIRGLVNIISVALLDLDNVDTKVMDNATTFKEINEIVTNGSNAIILYSWLIMLLRKSLILTDTNDAKFTEIMSSDQIDNAISYLSVRCKDLNVFQEIDSVNNVIKFDNLYPAVLSSLIVAAMPLVTLTPEIASTIHNVIASCPNVIVEKFFNNPSTIDAFIVARAKFPCSLTPFLKLASINGEVAFNEFKELKSYMDEFHKEQFETMTIIDDENTELVKTTKLIDLYPPYETHKKLSLLINYNTKAKLLPGTNNNVLVTFLYNFNGFAFLGRVLQNLSTSYNPQDKTMMTLIVDIFTLLTSTFKSQHDGSYIIETLSAYTDNCDAVEIILRLLEQGLHSRNIKVSKSITDTLYHLTPLVSDRIWNYLTNSVLLTGEGKEGIISLLFNNVEMVQGDYSFTISFIKFTEVLAHDCLALNTKVTWAIKSKVLVQCINHLILVFETFVHCKFNDSCQKMELGVLVLDTFSNILTMVYGLQHNKVNESFIEAASRILGSFLNTDSRTCYPLLVLIDSLEYEITLYELKDTTSYLYSLWISSVFEFTELLITIRSSINRPPSSLETKIFEKSPILVKAYATTKFRKNILDLMTCLTNSHWPEGQQPSLLSHLGRNNSQILLHSLISDLDNEFDDYGMKVAIYDFVSAVMKGHQQGLSVCLLGLGDTVPDVTSKPTSDQSLIKVLKRNIKHIEYYPDSVALHLVDSTVSVINSWSSLHSLTGDEEFIDELIKKIKQPINFRPKTIEEYIGNCYKLKLLSKIAELLAVYVFSSDKSHDKVGSFLQEFQKSIETFFSLKCYHNKLHTNIDTAFNNNFGPLTVSDFTCSLIKRNRFGVHTVYNLSIMDGMFKYHTGWPQLREQIVSAAVERQYLGVQVDVSKSLSALIIAICKRDSSVIHTDLIDFANHLLQTNINEGLPADFFEQVYHTRIELAFFLIYNMHTLGITNTTKTFELLKTCSELLKSRGMDFINNVIYGTGYYRPLLRIIYCSLSAVHLESELIIEHFNVIKSLFDMIVNQATKVLTISLQNDIYASKTAKTHDEVNINDKIKDVLLILSILKIFTELEISTNNQYDIGNSIEENGLIKSLFNLFTFSHLVEIEGEFVLSQFSLMFIQELLKFEVIAKQMVDDGLFTVLTSSHISNIIKNGDVNIISSSRYHRIWTNGILPILVFTLSSLGSPMLPEVCFALRYFKKQIESCIDSWSKDSSTIRITTATVNETSQLLILLTLLKNYRIERFLGIDSSYMVDVPVLPGLESEPKREEFTDYISNLLKHPKFLTSRILPSSLEEQRIIESGGPEFDTFVANIIEEITSLKESL